MVATGRINTSEMMRMFFAHVINHSFFSVNPGHRCNIERDSGYTKGDMETGQHMCLFFARGCCERGSDCSFLHRAPNEFDEVRIGTTVDIFGRERHSYVTTNVGRFLSVYLFVEFCVCI